MTDTRQLANHIWPIRIYDFYYFLIHFPASWQISSLYNNGPSTWNAASVPTNG